MHGGRLTRHCRHALRGRQSHQIAFTNEPSQDSAAPARDCIGGAKNRAVSSLYMLALRCSVHAFRLQMWIIQVWFRCSVPVAVEAPPVGSSRSPVEP